MCIIGKILYKILINVGAIAERKFNQVTQNPSRENEKVLFKILKKNSNSEFGIKFNFKNIKSIENFKKQVPLAEYNDYENYIKRMAKGEKNILISEKVIYFGYTSGTTGKQKLIPVTISSRRSTAKYILLLINRFAYNNFKKSWNNVRGLMIADIITTGYTEAGIPICAASSGGMKGIKGILPYLYTSPIEVMEIKDKKTALYLHLLFALKEDKLLCISGVFIPNILDLFRVLEEKHEELIRDIKRGSLGEDLNIDEATRKNLNKKLLPDVSRAEQLENEFNKGNKGIIIRIWPRLSYISSITGANFSIYNDKVNYYTDSLPIYSRIYSSTEGMIGINPYADKIRYVILPDAIFYEFIPIQEEKEESQYTLGLDELEIGKKYEIAVTNHAGLYRYRMGDVVKVVGFYNKSPEIEFLYRKNQVLNMVSEKTNEEHLTTSIRRTMEKLKLNLVDYTTAPDISVTPGRYIVYFELKDSISGCNIEELEKILDDEIKNSNLVYDSARSNYKLAMVKVVLLLPNTFNLIKECLINRGTSKDQVKIPRVVTYNKNILNIINENTARY